MRNQGVYTFFLFFALALLLFLLATTIVRLYYAGYVPKIFLVATAHSLPAHKVLERVLTRRCRCCAAPAKHPIRLPLD
jgi:hypothetical protein|eukprot:2306053-Prymnesium_polylepis.4